MRLEEQPMASERRHEETMGDSFAIVCVFGLYFYFLFFNDCFACWGGYGRTTSSVRACPNQPKTNEDGMGELVQASRTSSSNVDASHPLLNSLYEAPTLRSGPRA